MEQLDFNTPTKILVFIRVSTVFFFYWEAHLWYQEAILNTQGIWEERMTDICCCLFFQPTVSRYIVKIDGSRNNRKKHVFIFLLCCCSFFFHSVVFVNQVNMKQTSSLKFTVECIVLGWRSAQGCQVPYSCILTRTFYPWSLFFQWTDCC